jgi:hypothetical protein
MIKPSAKTITVKIKVTSGPPAPACLAMSLLQTSGPGGAGYASLGINESPCN